MTREEAMSAIEKLNGYVVGQKKIKVALARPASEDIKDCKIFVQNIPLTWTEKEIRKKFSPVTWSSVL
jgi:RNA recognition motif-containing protein